MLWVGGLASADPEELANGYSALLYSLPVIEAILMPGDDGDAGLPAVGYGDQRQHCQTVLHPAEPPKLFAGKAVFGVLEVLLLVIVLELACVPVLGRVHGYTEAFPTGQLVYLFICTLAVDTMLFFGEFLLMLWVGNPPALCMGIVGVLVGLFSLLCRRHSYLCLFGTTSSERPRSANWDMATYTGHLRHPPLQLGLVSLCAGRCVGFALAWRKVQDEEV